MTPGDVSPALLAVEGARIAYRVDGDALGPAIVMINSLGTDMDMWEPQLAPLSERFRVVRLDNRGHGRSSLSTVPVTIERLGRDVVALLDHLGIERAHLCGLSLGGMVALWLAARHPERVERAVLANTGARIGTAPTWNERIAAVRSGGMGAVRDAALARFLGDPSPVRHSDGARRIARMLDATDPRGYAAACEAVRDADLRGELAAIRAPSLIIAASLDRSTPPALSMELHQAIAGSELVELHGAPHLSNVAHADAFTASVLRFLGRE